FSWFVVADASADGRHGRDAVALRASTGGCRSRSGQRRGCRRPTRGCGNHATCVTASHAGRREARSQKAARPVAATTSRQKTGGARGPPSHKQKEKTMIFHINRATYKADLSEEQRRTGVEMLRHSGAGNPAVKSYVVGPELGGEFEYGAVYVVEDL